MDNTGVSMTIPPITKEQLIQYARASTDLNPIHTNEKVAREMGLPGVIAHGMLTMAFMGRIFGKELAKGKFISGFHARFKEKVFVGDRLTVFAQKDRSDQQQDRFLLRVVNQQKIEVASGYVILKEIQ